MFERFWEFVKDNTLITIVGAIVVASGVYWVYTKLSATRTDEDATEAPLLHYAVTNSSIDPLTPGALVEFHVAVPAQDSEQGLNRAWDEFVHFRDTSYETAPAALPAPSVATPPDLTAGDAMQEAWTNYLEQHPL